MRPDMLRVARQTVYGFPSRPKQGVVQKFHIIHNQGIQLVWKREYHVKVLYGKHRFGAFVYPYFTLHALAGGAVSVATRIVKMELVVATGATYKATTQSRSTTNSDVAKCFDDYSVGLLSGNEGFGVSLHDFADGVSRSGGGVHNFMAGLGNCDK